MAHHTDCTFIRVSGSELVQKYIGEGSRMVRELFVMARFVFIFLINHMLSFFIMLYICVCVCVCFTCSPVPPLVVLLFMLSL